MFERILENFQLKKRVKEQENRYSYVTNLHGSGDALKQN